jgi:hypothetical protein
MRFLEEWKILKIVTNGGAKLIGRDVLREIF